jgi:putative flippase GtrA
MSKTLYQNIALFFRYNTVALIASAVDFVGFFMLFEVLNIWYVLSASISASLGGLTAFLMNWKWVFKSQNENWGFQFTKYIIAWGGSISLNIYGLYLLVENSEINEIVAKIIVSVMVGFFYNFFVSKNIVFK